jgi:hypothetical protein
MSMALRSHLCVPGIVPGTIPRRTQSSKAAKDPQPQYAAASGLLKPRGCMVDASLSDSALILLLTRELMVWGAIYQIRMGGHRRAHRTGLFAERRR